jgi:cytochrome c5
VNQSFVFRAALIVLLLFALTAAAKNATPQQQASAPKPAAAKAAPSESEEGEKRFETNCGRCHRPPESLSPGEARTVLRQMRVRANLTAEDERLILKYLAP